MHIPADFSFASGHIPRGGFLALVTPPTTPEDWRSATANPDDPLSRPSRSPRGSAHLLSDREIAVPAWPLARAIQSLCSAAATTRQTRSRSYAQFALRLARLSTAAQPTCA